MKRLVLLLPLLALACNQGPTVVAQNASVDEVQKKVADAVGSGQFLSVGQWETKASITKMPGMEKLPPEMAARMKTAMGGTHSSTSCLTEEDVKKPRATMFGGDKDCRYDHFVMAGGQIDLAMTCTKNGMTRTAKVKGSFSPTTYHAEMESTGGEGPMQGTMAMTIDAKRVGECPAGAAEKAN